MKTRLHGTIVLAVIATACTSESKEGTDLGAPPLPYAGAVELQLGQYHTFGTNHRTAVHEVAHRQEGVWNGNDYMGLAAEVEICAGDSEFEFNPLASLRLFQEVAFDMQGTRGIMYSESSPNNLGLKQPRIQEHDSQTLKPGTCARGWVDFINVYGEHGKPMRLGFKKAGNEYNVEAVWPTGGT